MMLRIAVLAWLAFLLAGCSTPDYLAYAAQPAGTLVAGRLTIVLDRGWNRVSGQVYMPAGAKVLSQDGFRLDRLLLLPGVPAGKPLFELPGDLELRPVRANLRPDEIADLMEDSVHKLLGEGRSTLAVTRVDAARLGGRPAVRVDFAGGIEEATDYSGVAVAALHEGRLYAIIHLAATPYYAERHRDRVEAIMASATFRQ
jgi:hypothetical protein